jgi:molybdopterin/thiamine biosynthesis adenylyltransferase
MKHYLIGAGGVGSWLIRPAMKLFPKGWLIMDGDSFEEKNAARQLFPADQVGRNKAEVLAEKHRTEFRNEYFSFGKLEFENEDLIWCAVDNHSARKEILDSCDMFGCRTVMGSNERTSASAFWYDPEWKGTTKDPRIRYPEINTDHRFDPRAREIGCVIEIAQGDTQLVSVNHCAASLMLHMAAVWMIEGRKLSIEDRMKYLPFEIQNNMTSAKTLRGDQVND